MSNPSIYLERIDRARNMARYYRLSVIETLFGEWAVVREWGRIGRGGQSREDVCGSEQQAVLVLKEHAPCEPSEATSSDHGCTGWPSALAPAAIEIIHIPSEPPVARLTSRGGRARRRRGDGLIPLVSPE